MPRCRLARHLFGILKRTLDPKPPVATTTAGQVTDVLKRLGVPKERMVTVMIEPDDWLTKARQASRRLVIDAGLSDDDIDRLIKQAQKDVEPLLG